MKKIFCMVLSLATVLSISVCCFASSGTVNTPINKAKLPCPVNEILPSVDAALYAWLGSNQTKYKALKSFLEKDNTGLTIIDSSDSMWTDEWGDFHVKLEAYENNTPKKEILFKTGKFEDGTTIAETFFRENNPDGKPVKDLTYCELNEAYSRSDSYTEAVTYHPNGEMNMVERIYDDGNSWKVYYDENGNYLYDSQ